MKGGYFRRDMVRRDLVRRDFGQEGFWSGGILVRRDFG